MNEKRFVDIMVCSLSAAVVILGYIYVEKGNVREILCGIGSILFLLFLVFAVIDTDKNGRKRKKSRRGGGSRGGYSCIGIAGRE